MRRAPNAFPPARRIRRRGEFQHVFDTGRRVHGRLLTVVGSRAKGPTARLGIVASRKIGNAVARNRAKRLIREVFRLEPGTAAGWDLVLIPKAALPTASFAEVAVDYRATVRRLTMSMR
ncbi:MAG: ribonuclease P protein component [Vicinamibacterales bacterium]